MSATAKGGARGAKSKTPKVIIFSLPPDKLSRWPHNKSASNASPVKESPEASPPAPVKEDSSSPADVKKEDPDVESTPNRSTKAEVPTDGRKKGNGGPRGTKRTAAALGDGLPKPRAKPGPKKRKLDGPLGPDETNRPWTTPAPITGHKLGPKANQGAINAGLRALDLRGKPCRRWTKKGFNVKSFTGVTWSLSTWAAPSRQPAGGEASAENGTSNSNSNSERQPAQSSSNVGSDTSRNVATESKEANGSPPVVATPA